MQADPKVNETCKSLPEQKNNLYLIYLIKCVHLAAQQK